jgi:hypothetical protein
LVAAEGKARGRAKSICISAIPDISRTVGCSEPYYSQDKELGTAFTSFGGNFNLLQGVQEEVRPMRRTEINRCRSGHIRFISVILLLEIWQEANRNDGAPWEAERSGPKSARAAMTRFQPVETREHRESEPVYDA